MNNLPRKDHSNRIAAATGIGILTTIGITLLGGMVSGLLTEKLAGPFRQPILPTPSEEAWVWFMAFVGSYLVGSAMGCYVAGFWLGRVTLNQAKQALQAASLTAQPSRFKPPIPVLRPLSVNQDKPNSQAAISGFLVGMLSYSWTLLTGLGGLTILPFLGGMGAGIAIVGYSVAHIYDRYPLRILTVSFTLFTTLLVGLTWAIVSFITLGR